MAHDVMSHLVSYGEVKRGLLGVATQDLTPDLAEAFGIGGVKGAVVVEVSPGSSAAEAGLQAGDIITSVNGKAINSAADLRNSLGLLRVGDEVAIGVLRNGRPLAVSAQIGEHREVSVNAADLSDRLAGAVMSDIPEGSPLKGRIEGVLVVEVERNSSAWRYGIRPGDVVVAVNRTRVKNLEEMIEVVSSGGRAIVLNIQRGNGSVFILIQ
jgi:S1-C subfamily serine protease